MELGIVNPTASCRNIEPEGFLDKKSFFLAYDSYEFNQELC